MGWFEWLVELLDLQPPRPTPGTDAARLEEMRVGALLDKEVAKPAGQRDEELEWSLRLDVHKMRLANAKASASRRCSRRRRSLRPTPCLWSALPCSPPPAAGPVRAC